MILNLLTALVLAVVMLGGGLAWICFASPRLGPADRVALAPALAIVYFCAVTLTAFVVPWSFGAQAILGITVWVAGALLISLGRARTELGRCLREAWILLVPLVCCVASVAAFSAVQGDPADTVAFPNTLLSARVTNLPPDHIFPARVAQLMQHRKDPSSPGFFPGWDFADRTPLAGMVAASLTAGIGTDLPSTTWWRLTTSKLRPTLNDPLGFWVVELSVSLLNAFVLMGIGRLALSIFGRRAALAAGLLGAVNPFIFTHIFFTWPKMLAGYFILLHYTFARERRAPVLLGVTAGLAYLAHPLAILFVAPSFLVSLLRERRRLAAVGALALTVAPWQAWTAVWMHPSRMITYPLGYTVQHPERFGEELSTAWSTFRSSGLSHALEVRMDTMVATVWPFDLRRDFLTLSGKSITGAEAWFTVHDRTLGGMALFVVLPALAVGLRLWHSRARGEWIWLLVAPLGLVVAFWGIDPQGLGAGALQPTGALLVVLIAGGLSAIRSRLAALCALMAGIEAASVMWWGLFARRPGVSTAAVALAAALWVLPLVGLIVVLAVGQSGHLQRRAPEARSRRTRHGAGEVVSEPAHDR